MELTVLAAYLLHQVLISLLDAGVRHRLLWVTDGINNISLTALAFASTPAAQRQHQRGYWGFIFHNQLFIKKLSYVWFNSVYYWNMFPAHKISLDNDKLSMCHIIGLGPVLSCTWYFPNSVPEPTSFSWHHCLLWWTRLLLSSHLQLPLVSLEMPWQPDALTIYLQRHKQREDVVSIPP